MDIFVSLMSTVGENGAGAVAGTAFTPVGRLIDDSADATGDSPSRGPASPVCMAAVLVGVVTVVGANVFGLDDGVGDTECTAALALVGAVT